MDYDRLFPRLWLGSCPSRVEDINEIVRTCRADAILSLLTDGDLARFELDWNRIEDCCTRLGIELYRVPVKDGDSDELRKKLPGCAARLDGLLNRGKTVYLHCVAGLERSPSVAVAYFHWVLGYRLEEAADFVRNCRACLPDIRAIGFATEDILRKAGVRAGMVLEASADGREEAQRAALREWVTGGTY